MAVGRTFMKASFFSAVLGRRAIYANPVPTLRMHHYVSSLSGPRTPGSREPW